MTNSNPALNAKCGTYLDERHTNHEANSIPIPNENATRVSIAFISGSEVT